MAYKLEHSTEEKRSLLSSTVQKWGNCQPDMFIISTEGHKIYTQRVLLGLYSGMIDKLLCTSGLGDLPGMSVPASSACLVNLLKILTTGVAIASSKAHLLEATKAAEVLGFKLANCQIGAKKKKPESGMPAVTQPSPINKTRKAQTSKHFPKKAKVEQAVEPVVKQEVEELENEINEDVNRVETTTSNTGTKKHPCSQCEKIFTIKKSLQRHFGIHTDNPLPFSCHQCDKKFARSDKLNNHVKSAHNDNPNDENWRAGKNVVNKISAMTFQQTGKTSGNEKFVMKPKSGSSIVGKGLKSSDHKSNAVRSDVTEAQSKSKGEPTILNKIRAKMKDKEELTPEEREILKQNRRERRKKEKENKKKDKEEDQRKEMLKPQTSKRRFISSDILNQVYKATTLKKEIVVKDKGIKFMDEEYPDLDGGKKPSIAFKKEKVISSEIREENGKLTSDRESNSEWETEDDSHGTKDDSENETVDETKIEVITNSGPISYSSLLRAEKKLGPVKTICIKTEKKPENKPEEPEKKKVKKKDPIALDLFSALQVKKQQPKKNAAVLTGKLKKEPLVKTVRNQLDSSTPSKKRGKEKEGGRKKKKTLMKKIILADREKRKLAREEEVKRREDRIKAEISLKPLPMKDEEFDVVVDALDKVTIINCDSEDLDNIPKEVVEDITNVDVYIPKEEEIKEVIEEDKAIPNLKASVEMTIEEKALTSIHSRKFRSYCTHVLSAELDTSISLLMADLVRFQDKQHAKDHVKAKARRRYVVGLREVAKFIKVKKVCCVILAPDIERVETEGGLDDAITRLVQDSKSQEVSIVFGLNRRKMGKLCLKKVPVSCIGIMNYQGSDENYKTIQSLVETLKQDYKAKLAAEVQHITSPALPPTPARPQSTNSVLSTKAAAFVPSVGIGFVACLTTKTTSVTTAQPAKSIPAQLHAVVMQNMMDILRK